MNYRNEINSLIHSLGIKENWLAEKLEMKSSVLSYLLHDSADLDKEFYNRIKNLIDSFQFELNLPENFSDDNFDLFDDAKLSIGIGNRIRVFAKKKYGTLKKLAEAMEISPQQLQQYLNGKREPGSKILAKLLRLGCDINWLLGGSESYESYQIYKLERELKDLNKAFAEINEIITKTNTKHRL